MLTIDEIVTVARTNAVVRPDIKGDQWVSTVVHRSCADMDAATELECAFVAGGRCPEDIKQFWRLTRKAKFFEDVINRHWGLEIYCPNEALRATQQFEGERPQDTVDGDLVVGRLIGDSDLLILRTDLSAIDYGAVILAGPIDPRTDWDTIGRSFREVLSRYIESRGEMFWVEKT